MTRLRLSARGRYDDQRSNKNRLHADGTNDLVRSSNTDVDVSCRLVILDTCKVTYHYVTTPLVQVTQPLLPTVTQCRIRSIKSARRQNYTAD
ncbi:hypothetical protein O9992_28520 [Vibrio lentus]|nr:hypothetical protein [Vibrio lentus]